MTCLEFKNSIRDYLEGRLTDRRKIEFKEHLISCKYCREEMGENIVGIILRADVEDRRRFEKYIILFAVFVVFGSLIAIASIFLSVDYKTTSPTPISEETKKRILGSHNSSKKKLNIERQETVNPVVDESLEIENNPNEDFSNYSVVDLKARLSDCHKTKDYRCVSLVALNLIKLSEGEEKRRYRMIAIESFVELAECSSAMLQIMALFKENPSREEVQRAHLLNAACYIKERNFKEAEKIILLVEKDFPNLKKEITKLRDEIKKGVENGKQAEPKGVQDRDSP